MPRPLARVPCPVRFADEAASSKSGPVWVQVCREAQYRGHPSAPVVDFSRGTFQQLVDNFRAHPSYRRGPGGLGAERVVPYDYEHTSESDDVHPEVGQPAAGWILELDIRDGEDGRAELWALSEFLPKALEQIRAGAYRWTSVAVWPEAFDAESGEPKGPWLSSVALTNHPFVQGMAPIAASTRAGERVQLMSVMVWEPESPEELLIGLREIFRLGQDADAARVLEELGRFRDLWASGRVPPDLEHLPSQLGDLARTPRLATLDEVVSAIGEALAPLLAPASTTEPTSESAPSGADLMSLQIKLSKILKCAADDQEIEAAAEKASESSGALSQLQEMFGGSSLSELIAKATSVVAEAEKLGPALEALKAAQAALQGKAEEEADAEAEMVAATAAQGSADPAGLKKRILPAIKMARRACIDEGGKVDETKLAKFREDYPMSEEQKADARKALLTQRILATPEGTQLGGAVTGLGTAPVPPEAPAPTGAVLCASTGKPLAELLKPYAGRGNDIDQARAYLCSVNADFAKLDLWTQCQRASTYLKTGAIG